MSLRVSTKFTVISLATSALGLALIALVSWPMLQRHAYDRTVAEARLMLDAASAVRAYTENHINRYLLGVQRNHETFIGPTVPAFSATETFEILQKGYPEYSYREVALNPTNPENRVVPWQGDVIAEMRRDPNLTEIVGTRESVTGPKLYVARPIRVENETCLICHSTPDKAPASLIASYGTANGFGWKLGETIAAQIASVPMALPKAQAQQAFASFIGLSTVVFTTLSLLSALLLRKLVLRHLATISKVADKLSMGDWSAPELPDKGRDELAGLGRSFNRMRRSLEAAMRHIQKMSATRRDTT